MKRIPLVKKFFLLFFLLAALTAAAAGSALPPGASPAVAVGDSRGGVRLPVLMYHSITDEPSRVDDYTLSVSDFEADLVWLKERGFTSVLPSQLSDYVEKGAALPEKPVLITFDDGYADNLFLAYPLLQKYHMKAVISVIGKKADVSSGDLYRNDTNSSLSWGEISLLTASGLVEIGNHSYDLHNLTGEAKGANRRPGESENDYAARLSADLKKANDKITAATGDAPLLFAWPFGACPQDGAEEILAKLGFKLSVTSLQKTNEIKKGVPASLFGLNRFLRTPGFDISAII